MSLPANFSGPPGEEPHRDFRNLCREFKKLIKNSRDVVELQLMMERFINMCRQLDWHYKSNGVYKKPIGEKATNKLFSEFKRYIQDLQTEPEQANPQDLLDALYEIEQLVRSLSVS